MKSEKLLRIKAKIRDALEKADEWGWIHYSQSDFYFQTQCWNQDNGEIVIIVGSIDADVETRYVVSLNYNKDFDEDNGELLVYLERLSGDVL